MPAARPPAHRVLGLDPGSRALGWGVVEEAGRTLRLVAAGTLRPPQGPFEQRLKYIFENLNQILSEHAPSTAAVEGVFSSKNARSALQLGHARGVALLAVAMAGLDVHEYSPASVKKALVGGGRAGKEQVRAMVCRLVGAAPDSLGLDASDALAVAVCHLHSRTIRGLK